MGEWSLYARRGVGLLVLVMYSAAASAAATNDEAPQAVITADPTGTVSPVSPLIYGHFLEHFHRVIYGGIYDPGSSFADQHGFRKDVIEALRRIKVPILRWPGGCFASAYHWQDGIGKERAGGYDKAWRVGEPNTFGTDEFIAFCRAVGAEPYICGNAGTGSPEELSDWVEYCNLSAGKWGRRRIENGFGEPHKVRFWSIGNENWGGYEIGTKTAYEFARFVAEAAKMMRRVDGNIEIVAPTDLSNMEWNRTLLGGSGWQLDDLAIHHYADPLWYENKPAPYTLCMGYSMMPEEMIARTEAMLRGFGHERIKIAFDEWNLRGWHHPGFTDRVADVPARDLNDLNSTYTCADAVYAGCFLNACLRHADRIRMANFAPLVNCRGAIFTHQGGIVLRPTYHVFDLYVNHAFSTVLDTAVESGVFRVGANAVPAVDAVMTGAQDGRFALAVVNRHDRLGARVELRMARAVPSKTVEVFTVSGAHPEAFNDVDHPLEVTLRLRSAEWNPEQPVIELPPHSVNMLCFSVVGRTTALDRPLVNGDFERISCPTLPYRWRPTSWSGPYRAEYTRDRPRSGKWCVLLESQEGADCAWGQRVTVKPNSRYRLTGGIRTQDVAIGTGKGAFLEVQEIEDVLTTPVKGNTEWARVERIFATREHQSIQINCRLGGRGCSRGRSWFDDLELEFLGAGN